jgi:hypothetical protein
MKTVAILLALSILLGCNKTEVKQAQLPPTAIPSLAEVKAAVVSTAIQKGIIVTSVENAAEELTFLCKGELKTKPIPISGHLVFRVSEYGQWKGTLQFNGEEAIEVIVKKTE